MKNIFLTLALAAALVSRSLLFANIAGGGTTNWPFVLLSCTNLSAPVWTPVLTNQFDASGNFSVTNTVGSALQKFYELQLQ